ncbi:MAG: hypothetical protein VX944_08175 [Myxococcota bacterium]|nr:hypothetical protein [Myxococcota bacterium]
MISALIAAVAAFAQPDPFCGADLQQLSIPVRRSAHMDPELLRSRIIRPGLRRTQADLCRCLPRRKGRRPARVRASLASDPTGGVFTIHYVVEGTTTSTTAMAECMGRPLLNFKPIASTNDIVLTDGSRGRFPAYPLVIELGGGAPPQR